MNARGIHINGDMTQRVELSGTQWVTYTQVWDIDNRMVAITSSLGYIATYAYDADGTRVKRVDTSGTLLIVGAHFEVQASTGISTSYYYFGSQRMAMRQGSAVYWLHGDHLGSASVTTNITGAVVSEMRYYPFGETRWVSGTLPTDRLFTGQRAEAGTGLYDYNARMYSPSLGRFVTPDILVPGRDKPQAWNRYSYVYNNPLKHLDEKGHCPAPPEGSGPTICFALFIEPETVSQGGLVLHGDGRGFSDNSPQTKSRAFIWIDTGHLDKSRYGVNSTGYINPTNGETVWADPDMQDNKFSVTRNQDGEIILSYDLVLAGLLNDIAPHINGQITFRQTKDRRTYESSGLRDGFPWAEAYYHDGKGNITTIFHRLANRANPSDLNALEKLDLGRSTPVLKPFHLLQYFISTFSTSPQSDQWDYLCQAGAPC